MQPNSLDAVVSSVPDKEPVVIVHYLTGGYARRLGDLQVTPDKVAASTDKSHRFRIDLEGSHQGNNLYSFENLMQDASGKLTEARYMSANPDDIANGIVWRKKVPLTQGTDEAKAQAWYLIPEERGSGYALLNHLDPTYLLGMIGKTPHLAACGRPNESVFGVVPLIGIWQFVKPRDKECVHQHTPEV